MIAHKKENTSNNSQMPASKPHSDTSNNSEKEAAHTGTHRSKPSTTTHGYTVKKITNTFSTKHDRVEQDTGLNSVSIETGSYTESKKDTSSHDIINQTTIETGEFTHKNNDVQPKYPVIIDETDEFVNGTDSNAQNVLMKKEKLSSQQQNISIDISSQFCNPAMPSETKEDKVGSGKIVGTLGSGGMARVYKIWNEKLEIFRAVKILLPTNQKEHWDRFLTEAKITAKLHHSNIIETYDTGEWHGLPYMEMEMIEGDTLNVIISSHHLLPSPVCSAVALQIAKALAYAHSQEVMIYGKTYNGIIHRDLKPSNVMVTASGAVKLMDFGVARPIETGLHTVATDSIIGTMHYFSPEQIGGYPVDLFSDVYSFGAVLYEMLSGKNPFPQKNMVNLIQAKTKNQFKRLENFQLNLDNRLVSVAHTCLRTEKKERYENFAIISKKLEEIHNSYDMGSSEEVITRFYQDPKQVYGQFDEIYTEMYKAQREMNKENITPQAPVLKVNDKPIAETSKKVSIDSTNKDLWENKVKFHKYKVAVAVAIIAIVVIVGNILTNGKIMKAVAINQKYEQLLNVVKDTIEDKEIGEEIIESEK